MEDTERRQLRNDINDFKVEYFLMLLKCEGDLYRFLFAHNVSLRKNSYFLCNNLLVKPHLLLE